MAGVLTDGLAHSLAKAIEANPVEYWRACAPHLPGAELQEADGITRLITDVRVERFNQVLRTRLAPAEAESNIDRTLARFGARDVPMLWPVTPSTLPSDLGARLIARGLVEAETMPGLAVDLATVASEWDTPDGFAIERVADRKGLERWCHAYVDGFGLSEPGGREMFELQARIGFHEASSFRHYVGLLRGEPVGSSTLFMGAGVAGVWHVGVVALARRGGIGEAMTLAPLRDARSLGYRVGTLYASGTGHRLYRRLGFQQYTRVTNYVWHPEAVRSAAAREAAGRSS